MKVAIQNNSRVWGGNEKWLASVAAGLARRGHRVVVSCRAGGALGAEMERRGIASTPVRPGGYGDVVRGILFARWLARERPDALLLTSWKGLPWAAWAARRAGVPRTVLRQGIVRRLTRRHAWSVRRGVDAVIVNAAEIRDAWLESAPWFPADGVHVVLNGVAPPPPLAPEERAALRAELGAGPGERLVAGVGHVYARKGFDLLLDAFARAAVPGARVVIVGTGPEEGPLRARAERLGIAGRVRWAGHRGDVARVLAACDLFVLSSRNEGMANVMLEAMAAGAPVVATEVSGVRAALGAGGGRPEAGWIVPPDDVGAMAAAVRSVLLEGADAARRRVDEAAWRVAHWFGEERMVREAEAVLAGGALSP